MAESKVDIIKNEQLKDNLPKFKAGDTLKVHTKIREGNKERVQVFQGIVIACKGGRGAQGTFTVRKISYNVGVERTFLLHSPRIEKIEIVSHGDVRRAKLYYLRDLKGKAARIKTKYHSAEAASNSEISTPEYNTDSAKSSAQADSATA